MKTPGNLFLIFKKIKGGGGNKSVFPLLYVVTGDASVLSFRLEGTTEQNPFRVLERR